MLCKLINYMVALAVTDNEDFEYMLRKHHVQM